MFNSPALVPSLNLCYRLARKGILNVPGSTATSKKTVENLLLKDAESHHCFFRPSGFHNHLSHHLLAAYDLGAPAGLLQKIYDDEARVQRPILLAEGDKNYYVGEQNWKQHLGEQGAYGAYVNFFAAEIRRHGAAVTFRRYIFEEGREADMLIRLLSGALHPLIQAGYGAEFGNDTLIATGLAQAAMHTPGYADTLLPIIYPTTASHSDAEKTGSLLHLFRKVYETPALTPPLPYDPDMLFSARVKGALANGGSEALIELCASYPIHPLQATIDSHVEQITWVATLLTFATSKPNRKPRLDFFLMHLLTSSLFLRPIFDHLLGSGGASGPTSASSTGKGLGPSQEELAMQVDLLKGYIASMVIITLARGRPRIDVNTLMLHSPTPRPPAPPPSTLYTSSVNSLNANPTQDGEYNPWPAMLDGVMYHSDSHVLKTMRSLMAAARAYGTVGVGGAIGATCSSKASVDVGPARLSRSRAGTVSGAMGPGISSELEDVLVMKLPLSGAEGTVVDAEVQEHLRKGARRRMSVLEGERTEKGGKIETHPGTTEMDGTIFVRAAGVLMDTLGWVAHGQKEGEWDRSALGWEEAWNEAPQKTEN